MNEIQAALGLLQLKEIDQNIVRRKDIAYAYRKELDQIEGIDYINDMEDVHHNYSYFPIFVDEKKLNYGFPLSHILFRIFTLLIIILFLFTLVIFNIYPYIILLISLCLILSYVYFGIIQQGTGLLRLQLLLMVRST